MEKGNVTRYFLGANSRYGFYSLYDGFTSPASGDFLWVIKGGPGCGKSSFMKKLGKAAEEHGLPVEYIHCSGDPDSLDGVRLPTLRTAYADGTAPHVIESVYPGAASLYLDLGTFYDAGALETELDAIAGYIRLFALIAPVMYMDIVTDGCLKGLGQMMHSMRFNIAEAALGVLLVIALLPRWALNGYIFVIFFCEIFNFTLSIRRLRKVTKFSLLPERKRCQRPVLSHRLE